MLNENVLFQPYQLTEKLLLKNRIIMAPMTRAKAQDGGTPTSVMANYYARRADAGLIITEATTIRPDAKSFNNVPGIFTIAHLDGWRQVTDTVHQRDGKIFLQLWHTGRASHPQFIDGKLPLSASATTMTGRLYRSEGLFYGTSRAATLNEIAGLIESYAVAAKNAIVAGFDGVEIHGANGYLVDQFLHYDTNHREDEYGGTPQNMARFALEVVKACGEAIGYQRVGLRLSPGAYLNEIKGDGRDGAVFRYLLEQLNNYPIAYVHTGNFDDAVKFAELDHCTMTQFIRAYYQGNVIACGGYTVDTALQGILNHEFNLVALGRPFIANPDLINRLQQNKEVRHYEKEMLAVLE